MEEYLQYMKTLRSQMEDAEDQAVKVSVEEQTQIATIQTMEADLNSAKSETEKLKEDTEQMIQAKGQIRSQISEKQRKIASLESDSSTLAQTLELIQQERASLSAKLVRDSAHYAKFADELNFKLQQQQDWVNSQRSGGELSGHAENDARNLKAKVDSAKAKLDEVARMKSELATENSKVKQSIERVRFTAKEFKPELLAMDIKTLEEEYEEILSDKAGEAEYLGSLQDQVGKLKGISHMIKCACGREYKVAMDHCA